MNSRLKSVLSATGPMSMLFAGATMVVLAGVTLSPPPAQPSAAPAVRLVSATTPLSADGDNDSGLNSDDLFSADGSSGVQRDQKSFSGRGFSERQEDKVREEKKESYFNGWFDGFGTGHDLGSSAPASSGDHDKDKTEKSEKKDDLDDQLEDFQKDLKKIAKTQGGGDSGGSSDGKSSKDDKGGSDEAGGQGWISSLLAAIGQFVTALVGAVQGAPQG